jgi:hypothetical protein
MPLPGQGVVPTGSLYNELTATTRRAFVPRLFVQLYFAAPSLFFMLVGAQRAAGGLSQITIPVQGQSLVQGQFTGYGGGFTSPSVQPGIQNLQFPLAFWVVPIPLPFGETIIQATDREISVLRARMNDAWSVTVQNLAGLQFSNNTGNALLPDSFYDAFDDGTNVAVYGGINRTAPGNTALKGQYYVASGSAGQSGNVGFKRTTMSNSLITITDAAGGEHPTAVLMNPADYATLNTDFIGAEQIFNRPGQMREMDTGVRSSFPNLNVAGVPIFADHFCPVGNAYYINTDYTALYGSEDAMFEFSGFHSLVPLGQIGQQGVIVLGYNTVTAKPSANAHVTGIANPSSTF